MKMKKKNVLHRFDNRRSRKSSSLKAVKDSLKALCSIEF